jgi:hypothetical protein
MFKLLASAGLAAALILSGCAATVAGLNTGSASLNSKLQSVAAKIDAGIAVVASDVPALCQIAANAGAIATGATLATGNADVVKAAAVANSAASSAVCTQGLTGTVADAKTLASSVKTVATALGTPAAALAPAN